MRLRNKKIARLAVLLVCLGLALASVLYTRPIWVVNQATDLRLRLSGAQSLWVTLGGHRIHYYVRGPVAGPPIVLVHGLGGRSRDWVQLAPYLVKAGYRVYTPDLLGFGQSDKPADATYSIPEQSALVVSFMDAMGLRQTDLLGWSMGGWIVQRIAGEHPERIRRLVIVDSAGLSAPPDWDTRLFTPASPEELDRLDALLMPHPPTVPGFLARDIVRVSAEDGWVIKRALADMLKGHDVTDAVLPTLKMPVLLLWADQDHIMPLPLGRKMHALVPQSRLEIAPNCGHLAPQQCAGMYGPALVQFLTAQPPLPPGEETLH